MTKLRAVLIRRWPIVVVAVVLGAAAGFVSAYRSANTEKKVQYRAQQVVVSNRSANGTDGNVKQDALRMTRGKVLDQAAESLNVTDKTDLAGDIQIQTQSTEGSMTVYTFAPTAAEAGKRVDAFVKSFLNVVNAELRQSEANKLQALKVRVTEATGALETFDKANPLVATPALLNPDDPATQVAIAKRQKLEADADRAKTNYDDAVVLFSGSPPYSTLGAELPKVDQPELLSVPQNPLFRAGLLGGTALALAALLVLIIERVNQRIDTREELAAVTTIPIIAEIGHLPPKRQTFRSDGRIRLDGVWAEHYRRIRSAVQFVQVQNRRAVPVVPAVGAGTHPNGHVPAPGTEAPSVHGSLHSPDRPERIFVITSTLPGEGKSTSTALTALALAEVGVETVVINADFRKPRVDGLLGSDTTVTLADRARYDIDRPTIDQVVRPSDVPHLWTAASGPPTYDVGLRIDAAREVAEEAARRGATVLIDSTPIRVANDTIDLLPVADEVLLVVRTGRTTVESLQDTIELLELHGAPVLGIILIGTRASRELYAYYDSYYSEVESNTPGSKSSRKSKNKYGPPVAPKPKRSGRRSKVPEIDRTPRPSPVVPPQPAAVPDQAPALPSPVAVPAGGVPVPPPLPANLPVPPPVTPAAPQMPPAYPGPAPANGASVNGQTNGHANGHGNGAGPATMMPPPYQPPSSN
jgi:Mrp family chromosome partitioning ATPase/capsular polysaccharide biosynthesis protein